VKTDRLETNQDAFHRKVSLPVTQAFARVACPQVPARATTHEPTVVIAPVVPSSRELPLRFPAAVDAEVLIFALHDPVPFRPHLCPADTLSPADLSIRLATFFAERADVVSARSRAPSRREGEVAS